MPLGSWPISDEIDTLSTRLSVKAEMDRMT